MDISLATRDIAPLALLVTLAVLTAAAVILAHALATRVSKLLWKRGWGAAWLRDGIPEYLFGAALFAVSGWGITGKGDLATVLSTSLFMGAVVTIFHGVWTVTEGWLSQPPSPEEPSSITSHWAEHTWDAQQDEETNGTEAWCL